MLPVPVSAPNSACERQLNHVSQKTTQFGVNLSIINLAKTCGRKILTDTWPLGASGDHSVLDLAWELTGRARLSFVDNRTSLLWTEVEWIRRICSGLDEFLSFRLKLNIDMSMPPAAQLSPTDV